jgi:signal transduction histidine kinase
MTDMKAKVAESIEKAKTDLEQALADLERLPAFDPDTFVYAAHALGNYLNVAGATAEMLRLALADHPDTWIRVWLEGLQHATNLMAHTVSRLLNTSMSREPTLRREKVNMSMLTQRACSYYQRIADRKQIRIAYQPQADFLHTWTDRVAVAAVLDNLLSNAVKYSPPGSSISVTVRAEPGWVVCSVQDQGPGLSPEDQSRLFQRGVRLGSVPTGGEPSLGYGLAVAKELVDRLGGEIWCDSRVALGSTFAFRLPAYNEREHEPKA